MSSWLRNSFRVAVPGQNSYRYMAHLLLSVLQTIFLIRSFYVKSQSIASTCSKTFWWALQTQTEWVTFEPVKIYHLGLKSQNFENPIFAFGCFSLKAVYNYCKLQRLLQVAKFLFMYSFTHTDIVFLFRHLPTEIVIFINVCYQMTCSVVIVFPFLGVVFANVPPTFLISCGVQTRYSKTLKYFEQYIRDHLSGTKVSIFLHCLVQPNQAIHFLFHIIFIIRIRLFQTVNLYFLFF